MQQPQSLTGHQQNQEHHESLLHWSSVSGLHMHIRADKKTKSCFDHVLLHKLITVFIPQDPSYLHYRFVKITLCHYEVIITFKPNNCIILP